MLPRKSFRNFRGEDHPSRDFKWSLPDASQKKFKQQPEPACKLFLNGYQNRVKIQQKHVENYRIIPPGGPAAARPAPGVGNSLVFHVFFYILTLFWYPF